MKYDSQVRSIDTIPGTEIKKMNGTRIVHVTASVAKMTSSVFRNVCSTYLALRYLHVKHCEIQSSCLSWSPVVTPVAYLHICNQFKFRITFRTSV